MSNAERQRNFRAAHPGYYSRRRIKNRATIAALAAAGAPIAAAGPAAPVSQPESPPANHPAAAVSPAGPDASGVANPTRVA